MVAGGRTRRGSQRLPEPEDAHGLRPLERRGLRVGFADSREARGEELETGKPVFLEENECARRWGSNARRWVCCGGGGRGVDVVRALKRGSI